MEELLARFTSSRGEVLAFCAAGTGMTAEQTDQVYRAWVAEHGQPPALPFPCVPELLARFQAAGGRNFVFTHRSGSVHTYLAQAGLTGYFTEVVSAGTVFARKPDPAGNEYLITKYGWTAGGRWRWETGSWTFWRAEAPGWIPAFSWPRRQRLRRTIRSRNLRSWPP